MKTIITHDGVFHADEIFSIAYISIVLDMDVNVIRSRNPNEFIDADFVIDVGGKFDNVKFFDHHYRGFNEFHKNGIKKSSFGLIVDFFAFTKKYKTNPFFYDFKFVNKFKSKIVYSIDAYDNGEKPYDEMYEITPRFFPYTITNAIFSFNNQEDGFDNALTFATIILQNIIDGYKKDFREEGIIIDTLNNVGNTRNYAIFDKYYNWTNIAKRQTYSHIHHIIFKEHKVYKAIALSNTQNILKYPFPEEWAGLTNNELSNIAGIDDCVFVHNKRFIAVNKTLDGIILMVEECYK